jgi:hypothetical protein
MSICARIASGAVAELFTPPSGVDVSNCFNPALTWVDVTSVSPAPQPGWTATETAGVWTFAAPVVPTPTLAQQAQAMLDSGLQIVSTGTPALNGTYACDPATYQRVGGIVAAIGASLGLPGGGGTFNWPDISGTPHSFSAANFSALAKAMMDFEYALNTIIGANSGTLPSQPVTIP